MLFLASTLCLVDDIVAKHYDISGKKVGCIFNAAKEWWGKEAFWNKRDIAYFEKNGCELIEIDIENTNQVTHFLFDSIDVLFVWGGATWYLTSLVKDWWFDTSIQTFLDRWWVYMWTSAGSMLCCESVYDAEEKLHIEWLGLVWAAIIPHWWWKEFHSYRLENFDAMYYHKCPYVMLTDLDVLVVDAYAQSIETSEIHTYEELDEMRSKVEE